MHLSDKKLESDWDKREEVDYHLNGTARPPSLPPSLPTPTLVGACSLLEGVFSLPGGIPSVPSLVLVDKQAGTGKLYAGAVDDAQV